jgi:anti-sigma B factor antagonist
MPTDFAVQERPLQAGRRLIAVHGELDLFTTPELRTRINDTIDEGTRELIVDLSETAFVDSTGLGVLLAALKRIRSCDGELVIIDTRSNVLNTFKVAGVDQILTIVRSYDQANAALDEGVA